MMNKTTLRTLIIGGGVVLLGIILILCFTLLKPVVPTPPTVPESSIAAAQSKYTLREYQGKIALYGSDLTEPEEVFEIYTDTLLEMDILRLQEGITADSLEEAQAYLDDFDS